MKHLTRWQTVTAGTAAAAVATVAHSDASDRPVSVVSDPPPASPGSIGS